MLIFPKKDSFSPEELIRTEEAAYRKQIRLAAKQILGQKVRFVFLAGPSCSGKSTTAFCLEKALAAEGKRLFTFSTDDFFFDKERAPKNPDGTVNYDAFMHTDSQLIIETLRSLSQGQKTPLPGYDFLNGKRI
ncbi:MAG: nucleoside kinase, partial [Clostridia bacterium]|nr:nucleoside kinase [Clostridia bacterium]